MKTLTWFSPGDTLLVEHSWLVRVLNYADATGTLEVSALDGADPVTVVVGTEWTTVAGALEARYHGIFVNEKCDPARQAGIEFRDTAAIDVRRDSFKGVPIDPPFRMGQR